MITRVRVEGSEATKTGELRIKAEQRLRDQLSAAVGSVRDSGEWFEEDQSIVSTNDGCWGRLTWRRKDGGS